MVHTIFVSFSINLLGYMSSSWEFTIFLCHILQFHGTCTIWTIPMWFW
jgi:hypothetical protein